MVGTGFLRGGIYTNVKLWSVFVSLAAFLRMLVCTGVPEE